MERLYQTGDFVYHTGSRKMQGVILEPAQSPSDQNLYLVQWIAIDDVILTYLLPTPYTNIVSEVELKLIEPTVFTYTVKKLDEYLNDPLNSGT